ncbi:hypothetical protein ABZ690_28235 [Streptomyces sp. NPDC006967]|uniref:hypothetical protein n=1 Tax=Streptomyces sp. NPDC006967 TaxID=3156906 RepID=UPI0033F0C196
MARNIGADGRTVYRAAVTITDRTTRDTHTDYEGPYATAAAAQARVTFWTNHLAELHPDIPAADLDTHNHRHHPHHQEQP